MWTSQKCNDRQQYAKNIAVEEKTGTNKTGNKTTIENNKICRCGFKATPAYLVHKPTK